MRAAGILRARASFVVSSSMVSKPSSNDICHLCASFLLGANLRQKKKKKIQKEKREKNSAQVGIACEYVKLFEQ